MRHLKISWDPRKNFTKHLERFHETPEKFHETPEHFTRHLKISWDPYKNVMRHPLDYENAEMGHVYRKWDMFIRNGTCI